MVCCGLRPTSLLSMKNEGGRMTSGRLSKLSRIGVLSLSLFLSAGEAMAQVPGAVGQPQQRQERPDFRTAFVRESENYEAKGVRVGSFKLFAGLEADEVFNDNLYATPNSLGTVPTFVQLVNPTLELRSDWNNHMLNAYAKGGFGFYGVDSSLNNYQDASIGTDGRLDIQRDWNVYG